MSETIRVLLADDHAVMRRGIRELLESTGKMVVVAEAASGREVREQIDRTAFDVALLDLQMPEGGGIELTRWLRQNRPEIGIVILSAFAEPVYVVAAVEAGVHSYLLKTAPEEEILGAVRAASRGEFRLAPELSAHLMSHLSGRQTITPLSEREIEVLELVSEGLTNKAIGIQLNISERTVQGHMARICDKLGVDGRIKAVTRGLALGLIDLPAQAG